MSNMLGYPFNYDTFLASSLFSVFCSAPSAPRNVKIGAVTAETIQLSWYEPARANGVIQVTTHTGNSFKDRLKGGFC
jgi:hypothetical protein